MHAPTAAPHSTPVSAEPRVGPASSRVEVGVPNVATTATPTSTAIAPAAAVRESCSPRNRTATSMVIMGPVPRATA